MQRPIRRYDLETDGLLDTVTRIHVMVVTDITTGERRVFRRNSMENTILEGIEWLLADDSLVVGHNIIGYDNEVLRKLYGVVIPWTRVRDTMVLSRLIWADLAVRDAEKRRKNKKYSLPAHLTGSHSLEAWGHRLGEHKGDYRGDPLWIEEQCREHGPHRLEEFQKEAYKRRWESWNQAMEDYCVQDDVVTGKLDDLIRSKDPSIESVMLETQVASILTRQEHYGFLFDEKAAVKLYGTLVERKLQLEEEVRKVFTPRYLPDGKVFTPAKGSKLYGYEAGAPMLKVKLTEFNPTSRDHVAYWLKAEYGWEPTEFTADGKPKVDDEVISKLPYAEAKPLKEYFMVVKRLGQIAEGNAAWLKKVRKDGRIHGRVNTNGAVTGRMTHMDPNMGQVPACYSPYGKECRECFIVPEGKLLVGIDADALELRDLAGYMAIYDGGAYIKTVLEGDKSKGTDMHSVNCRALGMDPKQVYFEGETGRDIAKTWFYAFIYGAGDEKLGFILLRKRGDQAVKKGKAARAAFLRNLPAMGKLVEQVRNKAKARGYLLGLDGRHLSVRSQHAALNTLLQSAGAVQMKRAICLWDDRMQALGYVPGKHYELVATVHDELQVECDEAIAEECGKAAVWAIQESGRSFNFRCPLDGQYSIGKTWAATH